MIFAIFKPVCYTTIQSPRTKSQMVISSNANARQLIVVWIKLHQAEQEREDEIKSEMSAISMEVGSDSTGVLFMCQSWSKTTHYRFRKKNVQRGKGRKRQAER